MNDLLVLLAEEICGKASSELVTQILSTPSHAALKTLGSTDEALDPLLDHHFVSMTPDKHLRVNHERVLGYLLLPKFRQILNLIYPNLPEFNELITAGSLPAERLENWPQFIEQGVVAEYSAIALPITPRKKPKNVQKFSLNFEFFEQFMLSEFIGKLVRNEVSKEAAVLIETFYKLSEFQPLTLEKLQEVIPIHLTTEKLTELLEKLVEYQFLITEDTVHRLNVATLSNKLVKTVIHSIVKGRFSSHHTRVYNILAKRGFLGELAVSQLALLGLKHTQACLKDLHEAGFIIVGNNSESSFYGVPASYPRETLAHQLYAQATQLKKHLKENTDRSVLSALSEVSKALLILTKF